MSGEVDYDSLVRLVSRAALFSTGIVALGTTAEPCSLDQEERERILATVMRTTAKPIVVGVTGNDTAAVVRSARRYEALGASALLCVTPYYNRCAEAGLLAHYRALAEAVNIPVILYNVPRRTGVNITPDTLSRLLLLPHVIGVKEATTDAIQIMRYANICRELGRTLFAGDDAMLPVFRAVGAESAVSAAANAIPDVMEEGLLMPLSDVPRWSYRYLPLVERLFAEANPIGVKQACYHLGFCANELRLPLTPSADPLLPVLLGNAGFSVVND